jgi:hypothetical protein
MLQIYSLVPYNISRVKTMDKWDDQARNIKSQHIFVCVCMCGGGM